MFHPLNTEIYGDDPVDEQLTESIRIHGVLAPLHTTTGYVVLDGHRRLKAARAAGLGTIPVIVVGSVQDELTMAEMLLEANRTRRKNDEQRVREFMVYKRIEVERAKARMEHRADPVLKSTQAGTQQDAGKARDLAAKKVGMAWSKAEHGEAVVVAIDRLQAQGNVDAVKRLREVLNTKTVETAYREAVKHRWIVMPGKRSPRKRAPEANDGGSKVPTLSSDREPSSEENAGATQDPAKDDGPSPTSEHPSAVSDVNEKEDRVVDYKAPTPGTTPSKDSEGQSAPVKSTTVSANPARGTPPPSFENDVAALSPPVAPGQESRPRDTGGHTVDTTEVRHLITADNVDQAVSAVRLRELGASDGIDLSPHVRLLVPEVARLLNQHAREFPELDGPDLVGALGMANTKIQVVMKWYKSPKPQ